MTETDEMNAQEAEVGALQQHVAQLDDARQRLQADLDAAKASRRKKNGTSQMR